MIELYLGKGTAAKKCDLDSQAEIALNYTQTDLQNPTVTKSGYSKSVVLKGTKTNNQIFADLYRFDRNLFNTDGGWTGVNFDARKRNDFRLLNNGNLIDEGYFQLDSIQKTGEDVKYSLTLYGSVADFFYSLMYYTAEEAANMSQSGLTVEEGEEKTLDKLYFGFKNSSGNTMTVAEENKAKWKWDAAFIQNGWNKLTTNSGYTGEISDYVTAAPIYKGYNEDFDNDKCLISHISMNAATGSLLPSERTVDDTTYQTQGFWSKVTMGRDMDEWEMRELRSEYQAPCFKVKTVLDAISNPINNGGYEVVWDSDVNDETTDLGKYFNKTWVIKAPIDFSETDELLPVDPEDISISNNISITSESGGTAIITGLQTGGTYVFNYNGVVLNTYNGDSTDRVATTMGDFDIKGFDYRQYHYYGGIIYWIECYNNLTYEVLSRTDIKGMMGAPDGDGELINAPEITSKIKEYLNLPDEPLIFRGKLSFLRTGIWVIGSDLKTTFTIPKGDNISVRLVCKPFGAWRRSYTDDVEQKPFYLLSMNKGDYYAGTNSINTTLTLSADNFKNKDTGTNQPFEPKYITKQILWGNKPTAFEFLTSFTKLFNLRYMIDRQAKKVYIVKRGRFFTDEVKDITDRIDRSKDMSISPTNVDKKWYIYGFQTPETYAANMYNGKNKVPYGTFKKNTGYYFNNDEENLFEDNCFKNVIPYRMKSAYFNVDTLGKYWPPLIGQTFEHTLYARSGTTFNENSEVKYGYMSAYGVRTVYDCDGIFPKVCCFDEDNKLVDDIDCALVFYDGYYETSNPYRLTNNLPIMSELNGGKPCYIALDSSTTQGCPEIVDTEVYQPEQIAWNATKIPVFSKYLTNPNIQSYCASLDFVKPTSTFIGDNKTYSDGICLYDKFWKDYISDLYDANAKTAEVYYFLDDNPMSAMRKFYTFDNSLWILNEITDYKVGKQEPTKCTFLKVKDMNNYAIESFTTYSILPETYTATVSWDTTSIDIPLNGKIIKTNLKGETVIKNVDLTKKITFPVNTGAESKTITGTIKWHNQICEYTITQNQSGIIRTETEIVPSSFTGTAGWSDTATTFDYTIDVYNVYEGEIREKISSTAGIYTATYPQNSGTTSVTRSGTVVIAGINVNWSVVQASRVIIRTETEIVPSSFAGTAVWNDTAHTFNYTVDVYNVYEGGVREKISSTAGTYNATFAQNSGTTSVTRSGSTTISSVSVNWSVVQAASSVVRQETEIVPNPFTASALWSDTATTFNYLTNIYNVYESGTRVIASSTAGTYVATYPQNTGVTTEIRSGSTTISSISVNWSVTQSPQEVYTTITYQSSDGNLIYPYDSNALYDIEGNQLTITSNTMSGTTGTMVLSGLLDRIDDNAFYSRNRLVQITLPSTLTYIGHYAFGNSTILSAITITAPIAPDIESDTFYRVREWGHLTYPNGADYSTWLSDTPSYLGYNNWNKSVPNDKILYTSSNGKITPHYNDFYNASGDTLSVISNVYSGDIGIITLSGDLAKIGPSVFYGCGTLTNMILPNSLIEIGYGTFDGCVSLNNINIPYSVSIINTNPFTNTPFLTGITVDSSNTTYNDGNGSNCIIETTTNRLITGCINTTIPNSVTLIGAGAFNGCNRLRSIVIPNSVTSIEGYAFIDCSSLTSVEIPNSVTTIGNGVFERCYDLTNITIPDSVTSIGSWAFYECSGLTSVTIGNSVTTIDEQAFRESGLINITIPVSVTSIGLWCFRNCTSLRTFNYSGTKSQWFLVEKGTDWKQGAPFTVVHCSDGDVSV